MTLISPGRVESEIAHVDNRGRWHAAARDRRPKIFVMPAATAARHIVRAVARGRPEAMITRHAKLAVFLQRHVPWLVRSVVRRFAGRMSRASGRAPAAK